ncbi:hypothetical protein K525DRAFT_275500 [Schizophyllum commune Loenen D]|nr:hypothetical protein K525DRAFT_275500 [Schizophyllum commune Loenen D]
MTPSRGLPRAPFPDLRAPFTDLRTPFPDLRAPFPDLRPPRSLPHRSTRTRRPSASQLSDDPPDSAMTLPAQHRPSRLGFDPPDSALTLPFLESLTRPSTFLESLSPS